MCDTFVVLGPHTKSGVTLFAKNSDREPDEVQNLIFIPGGTHSSDKTVKCTYLEIPQAEKTYDIIISRPFWMFGCEMGANSCGVVMGNEAVFTNEPLSETGLLGMDMMRLALERCDSAKKALEYIIELLEKYGQGGICGYRDKKMNYHNSFLIADAEEAYVLETAGKYWVWKEISSHYGISNTLTIEGDYDAISEGAVENAVKKGKCNSESDFSFKKCYTATGLNMMALKHKGAKGEERLATHKQKIEKLIEDNKVDPVNVMKILRSHSSGSYNPSKGSMADICMHSALNLFRPSQTVNSFIAEPEAGLTRIWSTCGSAPCIQLYRPFVLFREGDNVFPEIIKEGGEKYDPEATWWRNELLHRTVLIDYKNALDKYIIERDGIEEEWYDRFVFLSEPGELKAFCKECAVTADRKIGEWLDAVRAAVKGKKPDKYAKKWILLSGKNGMPPII